MSQMQLSIHPRNWPSTVCPGRDKSNTAKPQKGRARKLDRKRKWLNARRNDREATIRSNFRINPGAYRVPGSMK